MLNESWVLAFWIAVGCVLVYPLTWALSHAGLWLLSSFRGLWR